MSESQAEKMAAFGLVGLKKIFNNSVMSTVNLFLLPLMGALCLFPFVSSPVALLLGAGLALWLGNPYQNQCRQITPRLLSLSIIGLGFNMNLLDVARAGREGLMYTAVGITATLGLGIFLGRILRCGKDLSLLITVGTAICGGSAIALVSSVIRARHQDITIALGIVFMLNAMALLIFPPLGHFLNLTESQFGLWSALAIHDTSSVVGATLQFGPQALEIGTTTKLARALWIIPVALLIGWFHKPQSAAEGAGKTKFKKPWFILGFVLASALVTWVPAIQPLGEMVTAVARRTLVLTLFLIGAGLSREALRAVGFRPLAQGVALWLLVSSVSFAAIIASTP